MAKTKKIVDEEYDLAGELEAATHRKTQYVVLTGSYLEGESNVLPRTYLVSRCAYEFSGSGYDADGRQSWLPEPQPKSTDPKARRTLKRLQGILREARERSVKFIICYHVEGDSGWYLKWSDDYDQDSARETMLMAIFRDALADSQS